MQEKILTAATIFPKLASTILCKVASWCSVSGDIVGCSHLQLRRHLTQRLQHLRSDVALPGGRVGAGKQEAEAVGTLPQPRHVLHHAQHRNARLRQQKGDDVRDLANSHVTSSLPINTRFSTTPSIEPVCAGDVL